jgi:HAD superfamily phosphatase (TIGR01668 family)
MKSIDQAGHGPKPGLLRSRLPNFLAKDFRRVDYDLLVEMGVRHLVFDVDNTLVTFGEDNIREADREFLVGLINHPKIDSVSLATNSPFGHRHIAAELGVKVTAARPTSFKPLPRFYRKVVGSINGGPQPHEVAMIGDKLVQDVWGANHVGITTVLVEPLGRDNIVDRLLMIRRHEKRILRKYLIED